MKTKLASIVILLSALTLFIAAPIMMVGCNNTPTPQSLQAKAKGIAYIVAAESLLQHPEWKPQFVTASDSLFILSTSTNVDMPMIMAIVAKLPIKELKGQHAAIVITAGTLFLQDEVGQVSVNQPEELRRVALGAHEGIDLAVGLSK